jgi:hypothetical protein
VNRSSRPAQVSVLIAIAALLAGIGGSVATDGGRAGPWFIAAGAALGMGLVLAAWPDSGKVSLLTRLGYRIEVQRLKPRATEGWGPTAWPTPRGTLLGISTERDNPPLAGFMCEVLTPLGRFYAYSQEAESAFEPRYGKGPTAALDLPPPHHSCWLLFPEGFEPDPPGPLHLPRGRYWVLWWAWERSEDGFSIHHRFVVGGKFRIGAAGLNRRREEDVRL